MSNSFYSMYIIFQLLECSHHIGNMTDEINIYLFFIKLIDNLQSNGILLSYLTDLHIFHMRVWPFLSYFFDLSTDPISLSTSHRFHWFHALAIRINLVWTILHIFTSSWKLGFTASTYCNPTSHAQICPCQNSKDVVIANRNSQIILHHKPSGCVYICKRNVSGYTTYQNKFITYVLAGTTIPVGPALTHAIQTLSCRSKICQCRISAKVSTRHTWNI